MIAVVDELLVETVERVLSASSTPEAVERAEVDGWCAPAWDALAEAGFPWISVPEAAGGAGGSLAEAMAVLRSAGRHATPVPLAETGVLAGWLAAASGLELVAPPAPATVVPDPAALRLDGATVRGQAVVAWARPAGRILALVPAPVGWLVVSVRPDQVDVTPGANLAGEPRDTVTFDVALADVEHAPAPEGVDGDALVARGALSRVALAAGALDAMSRLTVEYTSTRRQFGKPIASFQAVQHHLVTTAQAAVRVAMAADVATRALERGPAAFEVAAAKLLAVEAATEATRAAHQAHGAMGVTREYRLHHLSRRLWAWRHEYGDARAWRRRLGAHVAADGADRLFRRSAVDRRVRQCHT